MSLTEYPPIWVLGSIVWFIGSRFVLTKLIPAKATAQGQVTRWKWLNIANSLIHSVVTGAGALYGFYLYPEMATDVVSSYNKFSHMLMAFSSGYFIYDFFDMLMNHRKRSSYELMVHHGFVITCFLLAVLTRYYIGFGMVSLLVEVNSTFLHWRQLLLLRSVPKTNGYYRKVSLTNLASFIMFRIVPLGWQTRWLALNGHTLPVAVYALGCVCMACIVGMSVVLFFRLLRADFHGSGKDDKAHGD